MSTRKIKIALHDIIEKEDKKKPISDDALAKLLKEKGFPIARRTVGNPFSFSSLASTSSRKKTRKSRSAMMHSPNC
jgi:DNA-directed RNA polymerase specialized sigma54-like protein